MMDETRKSYTKQEAKQAFVYSMYDYMTHTLAERNIPNFFHIEGSSIFVDLPTNYFTSYTTPEGMKIEIKFVAKKD